MDKYTKKLSLQVELAKQGQAKFESELSKSVSTAMKEISKGVGKEIANGLEIALGSSAIGSLFAKSLSDALRDGNFGKALFSNALKTLSAIFESSLNELSNMLSASKMSNVNTRSMTLGYGLSKAQAYGAQKALDVVGIDSIEDLYWANEQETKQFRESFQRYTDYYTTLAESGYFKDLQDYQYEMKNFNEEMNQIVIRFIVDNKDVIVAGMKAMITLSETMLKVLGAMLPDVRNASEMSAKTSDIIAGARTTNTTSVQFYNNFNGVTRDDAQWIANSNELAYEQFIKSIS